MTVAILLASLGCSNPIEVKERETAVLAVRAISPPVARRFFFPPAAPQELWAAGLSREGMRGMPRRGGNRRYGAQSKKQGSQES